MFLLPPGVERSPEELEKGQVDIYGPKTPYATKELTYTEAAFDKLVNLCEYNILNNKDQLLQALRMAVEKKKLLKSQRPSVPGSCMDPMSASTIPGTDPIRADQSTQPAELSGKGFWQAGLDLLSKK